jgi:hypothetical protein
MDEVMKHTWLVQEAQESLPRKGVVWAKFWKMIRMCQVVNGEIEGSNSD